MNVKMLIDKYIRLSATSEVSLQKGKLYEVDSVVVDCYRIKVPMKRKGKFIYVLIADDEGKLID